MRHTRLHQAWCAHSWQAHQQQVGDKHAACPPVDMPKPPAHAALVCRCCCKPANSDHQQLAAAGGMLQQPAVARLTLKQTQQVVAAESWRCCLQQTACQAASQTPGSQRSTCTQQVDMERIKTAEHGAFAKQRAKLHWRTALTWRSTHVQLQHPTCEPLKCADQACHRWRAVHQLPAECTLAAASPVAATWRCQWR